MTTPIGKPTNLEIVRRAVEAFLVGDLDGMFALTEPTVEFDNRTEVPDLEGTFVGREGFVGLLAKIYEVFEDYRVEPLRFEASGDRVAVLFRELGRGRGSGIEVDRRIVLRFTLAGENVSRIEAFLLRHGDLREVLEPEIADSPQKRGSGLIR
jgi:ketosteroid isomerase-like protein